jgi:aspartyl-tRNA(Asn)/glutamyl-tRNA(Gln) amidotransferase subunit C
MYRSRIERRRAERRCSKSLAGGKRTESVPVNNTRTIDVAYVANLARIDLTVAEEELFGRQLEDIVGYVRKIGELDLAGIEPTSHPVAPVNVMRGDEVKDGLDRDAALGNAPRGADGQFVVPKIVE